MGLVIVLMAIPSALSFGVWSDVQIFGLSIFDAADYLVSNIILPVGALFIAIFVGYRLPRELLLKEFTTSSHFGKKCLFFGSFLLNILHQSRLFSSSSPQLV